MTTTSHTQLWQMPRLRRDERWLAGVAAAIAAELGVTPVVLRISFVVLTLSGGVGLALYAAAWLSFTYYERQHPHRRYEPIPKGLSSRHRLLGVVSIVLGLVLLAQKALVLGKEGSVLWPVGLAAFGMLLAWSSGKVDWAAPYELVRAVGGLMLVAAGVIGLIASNFGASAAPKALLVGVAVMSGVLLVVTPWLWRAASQVGQERVERERAAERAELAAHLHDSVLQTLSLIQRSAGDRATTLRLARRQERELREWLYCKAQPKGERTLHTALTELGAEIEDLHSVPVEVIVVGDAPAVDGAATLLAAAREALTNAATHAGAAKVHVYAEVCPDRYEIFVRDTGRGFDIASIPEDRKGVRESIVGRMQRAGGSATLTTAPGRGTEVSLELPRRTP